MAKTKSWLLPEGIEEVLPPEADRLESLRRRLLDQFRTWGYELITPPLIEYLDSLLVGTGQDLDLQTFKLTDQLTGRLLGVRADITPQAARIDAHRLQRTQPTRLCYAGEVLHTRPASLGESRSVIQLGAELYGHAGAASDTEILHLMVATLHAAGQRQLHVDIGHIGIVRELLRAARLEAARENEFFAVLQRRSAAELASRLRAWRVKPSVAARLQALLELNGDARLIGVARRQLQGAGDKIARALRDLQTLLTQLSCLLPHTALRLDLAELRGYRYHTGVVFAAYREGDGQALAWGGRYDEIGRVFGRARPATGFSTDLLRLLRMSAARPASGSRALGKCVAAPAGTEPDLLQAIRALRARGTVVITALDKTPASGSCTHRLRKRGGKWQVSKI